MLQTLKVHRTRRLRHGRDKVQYRDSHGAAADLGWSDSGEEAREDGKHQGLDLERQAAAGALLEDLGEAWQRRVNALAVLAAGGPAEAAVMELARVLAQEERLTVDLQASLAEELCRGRPGRCEPRFRVLRPFPTGYIMPK